MPLRLLFALVVLAYPVTAFADRQAQCIEDFERAQRTRKGGKLREARGEFRTCADASCPAMVRKDCTDALAELGTAIPSIRPKLLDEAGNELGEFTLEIDGARVAVDSEPIELDPGEHVLTFESEGKRVEKRVTLRKGELALSVVASLPKGRKAPVVERKKEGTPALAYVLGGVALVGVAGFVGFGLAGRSTEKCKGSCSDDEIDTLHQQYLLADLSLGVALVSGGIAGWLFLSPSSTGTTVTAGARF